MTAVVIPGAADTAVWRRAQPAYHDQRILLDTFRLSDHTRRNFPVTRVRPSLLPPRAPHPDSYALPAPDSDRLDVALGEVLRRRRTSWGFSRKGSLDDLSLLLHAALGVTGLTTFAGQDVHLRAYPAGSAAYAVEPYVWVNHTDPAVDERVWRYRAVGHCLEPVGALGTDRLRNLLSATRFGTRTLTDATVMCFLVGRTTPLFLRYGMRTARLLDLEAGHMCQNLQLVSTALEMASVPLGGYYDPDVCAVLGLSDDEIPLYLWAAG